MLIDRRHTGCSWQDTPYEKHLSIERPSGVNIPSHHYSSPLRPNSFLPTRANQHRCGRCIDPSTKLCQNCRRKAVEAHHRQMRVEQLRALQEKLVTQIPLLKSASRPHAIPIISPSNGKPIHVTSDAPKAATTNSPSCSCRQSRAIPIVNPETGKELSR